MIGHMRHGSPPRLLVLQSILSPSRRESLPTPSAGDRIRPRHSSYEAAERSQNRGRGGGGAKGGGQGEGGPAKHAPGPEPGKRVPGAGPPTANRKAEEEGTVHRAPPPHQPRPAPDGVP